MTLLMPVVDYHEKRYRKYNICCDTFGGNSPTRWPQKLQDLYKPCNRWMLDPHTPVTLDEIRCLFEFENCEIVGSGP